MTITIILALIAGVLFVLAVYFYVKNKEAQQLDNIPIAKTMSEYRHNMAVYGVSGYYPEAFEVELAENLVQTTAKKALEEMPEKYTQETP